MNPPDKRAAGRHRQGHPECELVTEPGLAKGLWQRGEAKAATGSGPPHRRKRWRRDEAGV